MDAPKQHREAQGQLKNRHKLSEHFVSIPATGKNGRVRANKAMYCKGKRNQDGGQTKPIRRACPRQRPLAAPSRDSTEFARICQRWDGVRCKEVNTQITFRLAQLRDAAIRKRRQCRWQSNGAAKWSLSPLAFRENERSYRGNCPILPISKFQLG